MLTKIYIARLYKCLTVLILGLTLCINNGTFAEERLGNLQKLIHQLDSNSCTYRTEAWEKLNFKIQNTEHLEEILMVIQAELQRPEISFEAQERLEILEKKLLDTQKTKSGKIEEHVNSSSVSTEDALKSRQIWRLLTSEIPVQRNLAVREIHKLIQNRENLHEILKVLRGIIVEPTLTVDDRLRIWKLEQYTRRVWLKSLGKNGKAPILSEEQLKESVDFLAAANLPEDRLVPWMNFDERVRNVFSITTYEDPFGGDGFPFLDFEDLKTGKREGLKIWEEVQFLEDALICEGPNGKTLQYIKEQLTSENVTPAGMILLKRLQFLTVPCMAAEYWLGGNLYRAQILQIGVPQNCGLGVSFFDSFTDETVHCQQGTNLATRDYLWGTAILHPKQPKAFFHLVPLITVESKLLYASQIVENQDERLRLLSEKTVQNLNSKYVEKEELLELLPVLNVQVASLQAGKWLEEPEMEPFYEAVCVFLGDYGTKEAIPFLMQYLEKGEPVFSHPNINERVRTDWIAALKIAIRDPWVGVENWLKKQAKRDVNLVEKEIIKEDSPMVLTGPKTELKNQERNTQNVENGLTLAMAVNGVLSILKEEPQDGTENKELRRFLGEQKNTGEE